jgi:hypothetical protein
VEKVSQADWNAAKDRLRAAEKYHKQRLDQSPKRDDIIREFGKSAVRDHPDGSWTASIKHDKDKMMRAERMFKGQRNVDSERGKESQAKIPRQRVMLKNGKTADLYEHLADDQARMAGARPMTRYSNPRDYYSLGGAARDYEQGPDGLYFHWADGWEPTNLWRNGTEGPQRDPAGNVWVEVNNEWVLKEETDGADDGDGDCCPS